MKTLIPSINGTLTVHENNFTLPLEYGTQGGDAAVLAVFQERLNQIGRYRQTATAPVVLTLTEDAALADEEYRLEICPESVRVEARGAQGQALALATLFQLLASGNGTARCCTIEDSPRYAHRGVMLDVCRHFFPADEVKKILEQASLLKLNRFHWHLSDDQGYRIESKAFPALNTVSSWRSLARLDPVVVAGKAHHKDQYGGYYTIDEIRDVVAYAAARGIEVIPEIDLPGHSSAVLAAFPQYTCSCEPLKVKNTYGVHERIYCAGNEEVYAFLEKLLGEVMDLFPSPYFHIGGDEAPKSAWKACPKCRALYEEKGFTNWEQTQAYFMNRVIEILKTHGKTAICWNDSACTGELDASAVVQYWAEMGQGESYMTSEVANGRKVIFANADQFYCTDSYASLPLRSTLMFEPNVKGNPVEDSSAAGLEMAMWTEWSAEDKDIETQMYPRMLAMAENAWKKDKDVDEFLARAKAFLDVQGLNLLQAETWDKATISGEPALQEIAMSMMMLGGRYRALADAEAEDGGEAGMVGAVTPDEGDDTPKEAPSPEMMVQMIRGFVAGKMAGNYPDEDIDKVVGIILQAQAKARGMDQE